MSGRRNTWGTPSTSWIVGKTRCQDPMQFWRMLIALCVSLKLITWAERGRLSQYLNYVSRLVWKTDMLTGWLSDESLHGLIGVNLACELKCYISFGVMYNVHARCKKSFAYATCVLGFSYMYGSCIPCEINTYSQQHFMGFMCLPIHIHMVVSACKFYVWLLLLVYMFDLLWSQFTRSISILHCSVYIHSNQLVHCNNYLHAMCLDVFLSKRLKKGQKNKNTCFLILEKIMNRNFTQVWLNLRFGIPMIGEL
jgi:hypothetical protein